MDSDADPDPAIFVIDLQGANKKLIFNKIFSAFSRKTVGIKAQKMWIR
jgi:hypothetical protein